MTISRRLLLLVAIPLLALLALGLYTRSQLLALEARTRFVAEDQIASLTSLAGIDRNISELRVLVRNRLLESDPAAQVRERSAFEAAKRESRRLLPSGEARRAQPRRSRARSTQTRHDTPLRGTRRRLLRGGSARPRRSPYAALRRPRRR